MREIHPQFNETFTYYAGVPDLIREGLWNYLAYGIPPGGFLTAALRNDFARAMCSADAHWNGKSFKDLGKWILQYMPAYSCGSEETMKEWMKKSDEERRDIMIEYRLRPHEFDILAGRAVQ